MAFDRAGFGRDYDALALYQLPSEIPELFEKILNNLSLTDRFERLATGEIFHSANAVLLSKSEVYEVYDDVCDLFDPAGPHASLMKLIFSAMPGELKKLQFSDPDGLIVTPASIFRNSFAQWQRLQIQSLEHS